MVYEKYGSQGSFIKLSDPVFGDDFMKLNHATTYLLEWQMFRVIPEQALIDDIANSPMPEPTKTSVIDGIKKTYKMTPQDYIKSKTRHRVCAGKKPDCFPDQEFEIVFGYFRKQGFDFLWGPKTFMFRINRNGLIQLKLTRQCGQTNRSGHAKRAVSRNHPTSLK